MSIFASILRSVYKLSGAKKAFALPEDALRKEIEKQNRHRGVFTPTDRKVYYETIAVNGFPCLIVREHPKPSERAILYFFGGGMVIGPDKGDLPVMRKLCRETGCDVWFPFYPLCMEHCITETYAMVYECYRRMVGLYGGGNVSTCGFSSGGALALGIAAHNNAQPEPLPLPRHIVAVSPGEVPWNDAEKARMQALNEKDVSVDYAFMVMVEKFMRHGCENVSDYMLSGSRGDFTGVGDVCRILRKPVNGQMSPIRCPPARRWCIATVCCRSSRRQKRTLRKSWRFWRNEAGSGHHLSGLLPGHDGTGTGKGRPPTPEKRNLSAGRCGFASL